MHIYLYKTNKYAGIFMAKLKKYSKHNIFMHLNDGIFIHKHH